MIDLEKLKARASECQNVTDGVWLSKAADEIEYMRSVFAKSHQVAPAVDAQPVVLTPAQWADVYYFARASEIGAFVGRAQEVFDAALSQHKSGEKDD